MYSFQKQLWSDCISEFTKLINVHPENADYYMYRGRSYAAMSFFVEALEDLTRAVRLEPDNSAFYFHRGCLMRDQNPARAIQDLSVSIMLDETTQNSDAYFYRAQLYQKLKHNELAIKDYLSSVAINPKKSKALLNLGILYMRFNKNYNEALNYINRAIMTGNNSLHRSY
jgi:tetratricopeptide (TPR) repeat protein